MDLATLFKQLSLTEFANVAIGNDGAGTIRDKDKERVVQWANEGILRLHSRFLLLEKDVRVKKILGRVDYPLSTDHALSNAGGTDGPHYIEDNAENPFLGDVLRVLEAYGMDGAREYTLNNSHQANSIFTPQPDLVRIPYPDEEDTLILTYQARAADLTGTETEAVPVPRILVRALRMFIAYSYHDNINSPEAMGKGQKYLTGYYDELNRIETQNLVNTGRSEFDSRFDNNGWV